MSDKAVLIDQMEQIHKKLTELRHNYWVHYDLFSWQWWLLLAMFLISWIVWWRLVDKRRLMVIVFYGVSMSYLIYILDHIGYELNLWTYPHKLIRIIPEAGMLDWSILTILHMLVYQYFRSWKSYIIVNTLMAAIMAFILEPISVWIGIYKTLNWEYVYSFPLYILKAVIIKRLVEKVSRKQAAANKEAY